MLHRLMSFRNYHLNRTNHLHNSDTTGELRVLLKRLETSLKKNDLPVDDENDIFDFLTRLIEEAETFSMP